MNYEEKYKDALEKARAFYETKSPDCLILESIFPELVESEDERIRKELIEALKQLDREKTPVDSYQYLEWVSWLEKQNHDGKKWIYEDVYIKEKEEIYQDGVDDVLENPQKYGLEKQNERKPIEYVVPETPIKDSEAVTSRMKYIDENLKPIAEFIIDYANWDLRKDEWNHPVATVPLFRVLDALVQNGEQYSEKYHVVENQKTIGESLNISTTEECEKYHKAIDSCLDNKEVINMCQPKFKVGDYVANDDSSVVAQIEGVSTNGYYTFKIIKPSISYTAPNCEFVDRYYHLWTINDVKEGDVVANETIVLNDTIVLIVDHLGTFENRPIIYSWYFADSNKFYGIGPSKPDRWEVEGFTPAAKEQRDLLFKKMQEAGYTWDAEKKELKKIEQKPFDYENANIQQKDFAPKAEPKFKVGDLIVHDMSDGRKVIRQIVEMTNKSYILDGKSFNAFYFDDLENDYHLWTIQDAKDGDVLAFDWTQDNGASHWQKIVIFKGLNKDGIEGYGNTFKNGKLVLQEEVPYYSKTWTITLKPATKEQRDFLFQKMEEAGYTWDAKKKQLIKNM